MMRPNAQGMFDGLGALGPVGGGPLYTPAGGLPGVPSGTTTPKAGVAYVPAKTVTLPTYTGYESSKDTTNFGKIQSVTPAAKTYAQAPALPGPEPKKPAYDPGNAVLWVKLNHKDKELKQLVGGPFKLSLADVVNMLYNDFRKQNDPLKVAWDSWFKKLTVVADFVGLQPPPPQGLPQWTLEEWAIAYNKPLQVTTGPGKFSYVNDYEYNGWKDQNNMKRAAFDKWLYNAKSVTQEQIDAAVAGGKIVGTGEVTLPSTTGGFVGKYTPKVDLTYAQTLGPVDDPAALVLVDKSNALFNQLTKQTGVSPESYQVLVKMCKQTPAWRLIDAQDLYNYMTEAVDVAPVLVDAYNYLKGMQIYAKDGNPYPLTQAKYEAMAADERGGGEWWDWSVNLAKKFLAKVKAAYDSAKKWADDQNAALDKTVQSALSDADVSFAEMQKYLLPVGAVNGVTNPNVWTAVQYTTLKTQAKGAAWTVESAKAFRDKVLAQTSIAKAWFTGYVPPAATTTGGGAQVITTTTTTTNYGGGGGGGGGSAYGGSNWSFAPPETTPPVTPVTPVTPVVLPAMAEKKSALPALAAVGALAWALLKQ